MLDVVFKLEKFLSALQRKQERFPELMRFAARNVMKKYMALVIEATPKPGDSDEAFNVDYVRTGRLVGGWGAAAEGLGLSVPFGNGEGSYTEALTEEGITLTAKNEVPYAEFAERIGAWIVPPHAPGGPRWHGGRHIVENARGSILGSGVIRDEVERQWKRL